MSRFGDTLRKALSNTPPALGFRPQAPVKPRMLVIASISELSDDIGLRVEGADAVILSSNVKLKEARAFGKVVSMPWGARIEGSASGVRQAETAGADFIVFAPGTTGLEIIASERLGKVMAVDASFENSLLHSLNEMPVEAIFFEREDRNAVTWLELMQFRRMADVVAKPLLIPVAPDTPPAQLKILWESGVDGVLVAGLSAVLIAGIRNSIDELPLPARRKWQRARPLVPAITPSPTSTPHEEEEEDEEE
jgi:hypothetical protein